MTVIQKNPTLSPSTSAVYLVLWNAKVDMGSI
jgi:hypothetical protein